MALFRTGLIFIFIKSVIGTITLSLNGLDLTDLRGGEPVRVIEGDQMLLGCKSDQQNTTFSWQRNNAITINATLEIHDIHLEDTGTYLCRTSGVNVTESKEVYVEVLYPPSYPVIEGISSGLLGELVTLKCMADANPEPTYEWRLESDNGRLLSRNQTYQKTIPYGGYGLVCKVKSLMVTTFGKPIRDSVSRKTSIHSNIRAYIQNVLGGYHWRISEGKDVNIYCATAGKPIPKVWWTKVGNESFHFEGNYLREYKTGKYFAGDYVCHAENTVITVNKTVINTHDTETIHVTVTEPQTTEDKACKVEDCSQVCELSTWITTVSNQAYTDNDKITQNSSDKTEQSLLIINGIGWTALVLSIVLNVWLCRKKIITKKANEATDQGSPSYSPTLPETQSYIQDVRILDNTYTDLSNYYQINSESLDSNSTVVSTATYMEPTMS